MLAGLSDPFSPVTVARSVPVKLTLTDCKIQAPWLLNCGMARVKGFGVNGESVCQPVVTLFVSVGFFVCAVAGHVAANPKTTANPNIRPNLRLVFILAFSPSRPGGESCRPLPGIAAPFRLRCDAAQSTGSWPPDKGVHYLFTGSESGQALRGWCCGRNPGDAKLKLTADS